MQVRVLGDLEVRVAGEVADLGGPKPRALLALLVAAGGRAVPLEQLIDQMWGEEPPGRVEASLQSYVARLRRALEPGRDARRPAQRLRTHPAGYSLDVPDDDVDARRFAALVRDARAPGIEPDRAAGLFAEALALWGGEPYAGHDSPSLRAEATRLSELRLGAVADLWELRLDRGEHAEAVAELEQLVHLYPLQERLWGLLALALYRAARQGDALAAVRRARDHLADELGVDPGPELRLLEEQLLRQDPRLDAPAAPAPVVAPPAPEPVRHLFGRDDALAETDKALSQAASGRGRVVLVTGEPGIGKSRLADAVTARAAAAGFRTGRGAWEAEAAPPLWAWSRALGALGVDALLDAPADGGDAASVSFRQADAVVDALRGDAPTLLVLDDVHWADTESLRLLRRVAADLDRLPVVLLVTTRSAPAEIGEPLADLLAALARLDPVRLDLAGLDAEAVSAWLADRAGRDVDPTIAAELVRRTDGNPFYLTELVRLLVREGALAHPDAEAWRVVPGGVRDVVRQRSRQLSETAGAVLATAAVVGRTFDLAVLECLGPDPDAVAAAVEDAQVLGLVDEERPGRYRFTHALVRDAVYESIPAPARARRHAAVAAALEEVHAGRVTEHAAELAEHYRLAGAAHARSAWVFARRAAAAAAERSAYDEALRLTTLAEDLQRLDHTVDPVDREDVLVAKSRALIRVSRPLEAWGPAEQAARSALGRDDAPAAAAALLTVTENLVWGWRTDPGYDDDAIALWAEVRERLPAEDALTRAHLGGALAAELLHRPGAAAESTREADAAVATVRRSDRRGPRELAVLRVAQIGLLRPSLLHHRAPLADEIVDLAGRVGPPLDHAAALASRSQDRGELGRLADAHSDVLRAHEIAEHHHLSGLRVVTGWSLTTRALMQGRLDEAERMIADNEAFQATLAVSGYGMGLCHLSMLRDLQGRLPELEPTLRSLRQFHPGLRELHGLAMVRAGRTDELRELLGEWQEQPELLSDYLWVFLNAVRAEVWSALGDRGAARELHDLLAPYADRLAIAVPVGFRGSVQLTLGRLAATLGEAERAREHLRTALAVHEDLGLDAWAATTEAELARL